MPPNTVQYSIVQYSPCHAPQYSTVQYSTVQYSPYHAPHVSCLPELLTHPLPALLGDHCTALHCTLHCTALHCTALSSSELMYNALGLGGGLKGLLDYL